MTVIPNLVDDQKPKATLNIKKLLFFEVLLIIKVEYELVVAGIIDSSLAIIVFIINSFK